MAAQNQHYVPKFILRQFLADEAKEQVRVYDKHEDKVFSTSIKNVMAERRFNEFQFDDDWMVDFEPVAGAVEDQVLPAYRAVIQSRRLDGSPEQKAALSFLIAFQFLRTRAHRNLWQAIEDETVQFIEADGGRMQDVQGWEDWQPQTEDGLKRSHLISMERNLGIVASIIAAKDFALAEPSAGRSFYLGDHPVSLANDREAGFQSNIGLAVPGIQIYLPLAHDLMLCAWCPTILAELEQDLEAQKKRTQMEALSAVASGQLSSDNMRQLLEEVRRAQRPARLILENVEAGTPLSTADTTMDFYNSLQTSWAHRHVICRDGDFALAREINLANPMLRKGRPITAG